VLRFFSFEIGDAVLGTIQIIRDTLRKEGGGFATVSLGVDFTNILFEAFTHADPKSAKKTDSLTCYVHLWDLLDLLCALMGSARVKASRKMLVKLTPDDTWGERIGVDQSDK